MPKGKKYSILFQPAFIYDPIPIDVQEKESLGFSIEENPYSLSFIKDSLFYDANLSFLIHLFQCFQNLIISERIFYESYSQSFTTYCLKLLTRHGIIEIVRELKEKPISLTPYFEARNETNSKKYPMTTILFRKKRSITKEDLSWLYPLLKMLHIDLSVLKWKEDYGKLHVSISKKLMLENVQKGVVSKRILQKNAPYKKVLKGLKEV